MRVGKQNYAESPREKLRVCACSRQQGTCEHTCVRGIRIWNRICAPSTLNARTHTRTCARSLFRTLTNSVLVLPGAPVSGLCSGQQYGFQDTSSFLFYGTPISINVVATK